ncbi:MAG TPA: hypothetical protein VFR32_02925 [Gaiellaceae bacterium]|nr:hypothetical protein [Gaiellaceae bacterium]
MSPVEMRESDSFTQVRLPARLFSPTNAATYKKLAEVPRSYVVEMPPRKPAKLVRKPEEEKRPEQLASVNIFPNPIARPEVPRFDVSLKEPVMHVVNVMVMLLPHTFLGSVSIPPGETLFALSAPIPPNVLPGVHTVAAMADESDTVTASLRVLA